MEDDFDLLQRTEEKDANANIKESSQIQRAMQSSKSEGSALEIKKIELSVEEETTTLRKFLQQKDAIMH